jgi:ribosomal protein S6--L-glutamate ligase
MKLCILSRGINSYSTKRLREAAENRGHKVKVLDTMKFSISLEQENPDLYFRHKQLTTYDAVLPRIGSSVTFYGTAIVRQFQQMGVYCANTAQAITNSRDKLRSAQLLSRHNIGIPETQFVKDKKDVLPAIERLGGCPVIIKLLEGTQGVGVILAETTKVAQAIIETLQSMNVNILIQKFVAESKGKDIRAFVVGDRVVAGMRRVAEGDEFRSNIHRGGKAEVIELDKAYVETALQSARILGLNIAGVDMLEGDDGPKVLEVNSSPGLEGIERATQKDIAGEIIDYISENVKYPEMDLRQRLSVSKGYSVVELYVSEKMEMAGKTIKESGLREKDIVILNLQKGESVISNPRVTRILESGDTLLCYGKVDNMKDMLPDKVRKRKRRKLSPIPDDALVSESESDQQDKEVN